MSTPSFNRPQAGLRDRATSGVMSTGLAQCVRLLVQLVSVVALSRLLLPSEFGLVAMAGPIVGFAALFQDLGLTQAVVQKPEISHAELSTLFWVMVGGSVAITALLIVLSPLVGWFYNEPRAGVLTAALSLNIILSALSALNYALLSRRMQFGLLALMDALASIGGLVASIGVALIYRSFWALYAGTVTTVLIPMIGFWIATGWRPSPPRRGSGVRNSLRFGIDVTGFNMATFLARNLDNVLIGRTWGEQPLGLYDRADKLLLLPLQQFNNPISKVMLPVLSRLAGEPGRYRQAYLRTLSQMLLVTLPGIAAMVATADTLIPMLLGQRWHATAETFAALGLASLVQALNNPSGWLFVSQSRTRDYMLWGLFNAVTSVGSFAIGLPYGPFGVAVAYTVGEYLRTPILWWYVGRSGPVSTGDIARMALPHFTAAGASLAVTEAVRPLLPASPLLAVAASFGLSFLVSVLMLCVFSRGRETLFETTRLLRRPVSRRPVTL